MRSATHRSKEAAASRLQDVDKRPIGPVSDANAESAENAEKKGEDLVGRRQTLDGISPRSLRPLRFDELFKRPSWHYAAARDRCIALRIHAPYVIWRARA